MNIKCWALMSFLLLGLCHMNAQKYNVEGFIKDQESTYLLGAVAVLITEKDSIFTDFASTDNTGFFKIENVKAGDYLLQITYVGFGTIQKRLSLEGDNTTINLGQIVMSPESEMLEQITITDDYIPIKITKDTIEFNADAFKTQPNAVVEDLLKKLPGVEVDEQGGIKVQGEEVKSVTVDGKNFFGKDPKMATKNLPADAVKKVQVFDKKSKTAEFTGVDDGADEKTINLELKEDKKKGYFGNANVGVGTDQRYEGKILLNRFSKKTQMSVIGTLNNLNQSGISVTDYFSMSGSNSNMFRVGNNSNIDFGDNKLGEIASGTIGTNLNYDLGKERDINVSYSFSKRNTDLLQNSFSNSFFADRVIFSDNNLSSVNEVGLHNLSTYVELPIDSTFEISYNLSMSYSDANKTSSSLENTLNQNEQLVNRNVQDITNTGDNLSLSTELNLRKKLKKKGRLWTIDGRYNLGNTTNDYQLSSEIFDGNLSFILDRSIFQLQAEMGDNISYSGGLGYTEPLGKNIYLNINTNIRNNRNDLVRNFFNLDPLTLTVQGLNEELSRSFDNTFVYSITGMNIRKATDKYNANIGVDYQISNLSGMPSIGANIDRNFSYFLPKASFRLDGPNIRLNYSTSVREPSMDQLQPVVDNTDPLNVYVGNPDLIPEYRHNLRLSYNFFDQFNFKSLFSNISATYVKNRITTASFIDEFFIRQRTPLNTSSETSVSMFAAYSAPFKMIRAKYRLSINASLTNGINFINTLPYDINRLSQGISFTIENKSKNHFDLSVYVRLSANQNLYKDNEGLNSDFINKSFGSNIIWFAGKGWTLDTKMDVNIYGQGSFQGSTNINLWQAAIAKAFFNNVLTTKILAFDLLNQNQGIARTASETFISESLSNTIGRYFMVSVQYNINAIGAPKRNDRIMIMRN